MPRIKTIAELRREIAVREKRLAQLQNQRKGLAKRLAGLDREIVALSGEAVVQRPSGRKKASRTIAAKRAGHPRRGASLGDVLANVMAGAGNVKVADAAKTALKAGYKTKSSQFGNIVSQALSTDKRFEKISRGIYALKGGTKPVAGKKIAKKIAKKAKGKPAKGAAKAARATGKSLVECIRDVLAKAAGGMRVKDIMTAVQAAGYESGAKDFYNLVAAAVRGDGFEKLGRGVYRLKAAGEPAAGKKTRKGTKRTAKRRAAKKSQPAAKGAQTKAKAAPKAE